MEFKCYDRSGNEVPCECGCNSWRMALTDLNHYYVCNDCGKEE